MPAVPATGRLMSKLEAPCAFRATALTGASVPAKFKCANVGGARAQVVALILQRSSGSAGVYGRAARKKGDSKGGTAVVLQRPEQWISIGSTGAFNNPPAPVSNPPPARRCSGCGRAR